MLLTPRRLFILLGVLAALAIIAFRGQSLLAERRSLLEQRQTQTATLAQFAATYSAGLYDESARLAQAVASYVAVERPTPEQLKTYLTARAADTTADDYIVVLDAEGAVTATSEQTATQVSYAAPDFAQRMMTADQRVVPVLRSRLTGDIVYPLSHRILDEKGALLGVVGVNIRPQGIRTPDQRKPTDPLLTIWTQDGRFIAASFVAFDAKGQAIPPARPAGLGIPGGAAVADPNVLSATVPVTGWPLVAVASFDRSGVLTPWRKDMLENIGLIFVVLLGIGGLVWFGVRTADRETAAKQDYLQANAMAVAALHDRDLLLKEIHHRVKNSLTMTAGLIHLQERRFDDPQVREAFESTRRRLNSIGLVHEALYSGSSLQAVDLAPYLERLLAEIADAHGADARQIKLVAHIDPIALDPGQATPVGLIVAEVVTNAFKHAFGPEGGGEITVTGRMLNRDEVQIEVRDDGKGYGDLSGEGGTGLGSRLIRALTDQLQGILSRSNEEGAALRVTFPLKAP